MKRRIKQFLNTVHGRLEYLDHPAVCYSFRHEGVQYMIVTDERKIAVICTKAAWDQYHQPKRTYIQDIFPELTGMERQYIQSGMFFGVFDGKSFENFETKLNAQTA